MGDVTVSQINIYPVKSMAGLSLEAAQTETRGLVGDRRWMLVDDDAVFWCQRRAPRMVLLKAYPTQTGLRVTCNGMDDLHVSRPAPDAERLEVKVQRDVVSAPVASANVNAWFTQALGLPCRLVHMDATCDRKVRPKFGDENGPVSFADANPFMIVSRASLAQLNDRLETPVPMARFRPNLVVDGVDAFEEDHWRRIRIGQVVLEVTCRINRCAMIKVDPATGQADQHEPFRTLKTFRRDANGLYFGVGAAAVDQGLIRQGDTVEILDRTNEVR